jgi:DNA-binding CsgD family transcriptional regulator/tetratricopeptide (TPR) repeat protein
MVEVRHLRTNAASRALHQRRVAMRTRRAVRGRQLERQRLAAVLDVTAATGRGAVVSVIGRAGMGKTTVLSELRAVAADKGFTVVSVGSDEDLRPEAFASLLVGGRSAGSGCEGAFGAMLDGHLARGPVLVTADGLQWCHAVAARTLNALAAQAAHRPLVCVVAERPDMDRPYLDQWRGHLRQRPDAVRVELPRMAEPEVAALVEDVLGVPPDTSLTMLVGCAGGIPATVVELLGVVADEGVKECQADFARIARLLGGERFEPVLNGGAELPHRFSEVLHRSLGRLSEETRRVLDVASVLGRTFLPDDLARLLDQPLAALLPAFREAFAAEVLENAEQSMCFRNTLLWQALLQNIPDAVRGALHRQAAATIIARGGSPVDSACHVARGAFHGDEAAIRLLRDAAEQALRPAPRTAAELALRGLELLPPGHEACLPLTEIAVEACARSGPVSRAVQLAEDALTGALPETAKTALRYWLSTALTLGGRHRDAGRVAESVLSNPQAPAELRHNLALNRELVTVLRRDQPPPERQSGLPVLSAMRSWREGRLTEALTLCRKAVADDHGGPVISWICHPLIGLAEVLTCLEYYDEALAVIDEAAEHVDHALSAVPRILRARVELAVGRTSNAVPEAMAGLRIAHDTGTHLYLHEALYVLTTATLRTGAGRPRGEDPLVAWARAESSAVRSLPLVWAEARLAEAHGDPGPARALLHEVALCEQQRRELFTGAAGAAAWTVRTALAEDRADWATAAVATAERLAAANPEVRTVAAAAAHARGLLDRDRAALAAASAFPGPWERASAAEDLGRVLLDADRESAVRHLEQSAALYQEILADPDATRVRSVLRAAGVVRRHWRQRGAGESTGADALTDTERKVADLVASGLTNRQVARRMFISHHTVAFHLRKVFRKLEVTSRVELARRFHSSR